MKRLPEHDVHVQAELMTLAVAAADIGTAGRRSHVRRDWFTAVHVHRDQTVVWSSAVFTMTAAGRFIYIPITAGAAIVNERRALFAEFHEKVQEH